VSVAALAHRAGASLRLTERCFLRETGVALKDPQPALIIAPLTSRALNEHFARRGLGP